MSNRLRLLQVEDSQSDADLVVRLLERAGYDVHWTRVEDSVEMGQALASGEWDVIICDYRLPHFDAPTALNLLHEADRDIPFIVVSGAIGEDLAVEMMKRGAHDYLMKDNLRRLAPAVTREIREARDRCQRNDTERALRESQRNLQVVQQRAEAARRHEEQRERLEAILSSLGEGILIAEPDGTVLSMNPAAHRLLEIDSGGCQQWHVDELGTLLELTDLEGTAVPIENHPLRRALRGDTFEGVELCVHQTNTGKRWIGCHGGGPVRDRQGRLMLAVITMRDVTPERTAARKLEEANVSLHQLTGQLLRLQDDERRRIARELHDGTVQRLAALAMNLLLIGQAPAVEEDPVAQHLIAESQTLIKESQRELRTLSYLLHPPDLEQLGLASALRSWVDGFAARAGLAVEIEVEDPGRLNPEVETALFRIAQESLANVQKHSGSLTAAVRLFAKDEEIRLEVEDSGRGVPPDVLERNGAGAGHGIGVGILGMRERARQLGGSLELVSNGHGTTVRVALPRTVSR